MNIEFDKKVLESALTKTIKAVNPRSPLPILNYVLIKCTEDGKVMFSTTDLEFGIECKVEARIYEEGMVCVPAKIITELVNSIQEDKVSIKQEGEKPLELTTNKSKYHINVREVDEFPILPKSSDEPLFTIPQLTFREMIKNVIIAVASLEEQRAALTGVFINVDDKGITAVSTDSRRLIKVSEPLDETPAKSFSVIVPQRSLKEIQNLLSDKEEPVSFIFSEGQIFLSFGNINVFSRIIDGKFPNYEVVIPRSSDIKLLIDRRRLLDSVKRALIMAENRETPDLLRLEIGRDTMKIMANSVDIGDAHEEVQIQEMEGDNIELAINGRYLYEVLNVMSDEFVWVLLNSPVMPLMLKTPQKDTYDYIVMPVRLHKEEEEMETDVPVSSYT
ncbi:MAG: DNA polymerase III subunit beta [Vulcanimicrobiota bacterium]